MPSTALLSEGACRVLFKCTLQSMLLTQPYSDLNNTVEKEQKEQSAKATITFFQKHLQ